MVLEGCPRVCLREATMEDAERVWWWRNDPETRRASFDEREIPLEEHRRWFDAAIRHPHRRMYLVLAEGMESGVLRLDLEGAEATVSINIAPARRARGIGTAALRAVAERAFGELGLRRLVAKLKAENAGSRKAFEGAGFRVVREGDPLTMVLLASGESAPLDRLEKLWRGRFGREYTDRNAAAGERRGRFWRDLLSECAVATVLEVGCNLGANLRWIRAHVPPGRVIGVDVSEYALAGLRRALPDVHAAVAVARKLPFRDEAFDLVFTMGVLIHHAPESLADAMAEIVRCSRRYVLCGEYFAEAPTEVFYRGQHGALFKQDFGARYRELFPGLRLLREGRLFEADGWDDVTFWLFEKPGGRCVR